MRLNAERTLSTSSSINNDLYSENFAYSKTTTDDWLNDDEDLIFAKLIVIRLKKFNSKDKRTVRKNCKQLLSPFIFFSYFFFIV